MLIDFKVKNFRSFKEEQSFSMRADSSKNKPDNFFEIELAGGKKVKLLHAAVIYGANASGKTNLIRAFRVFQMLVQRSSQFNAEEKIAQYDPFLLDSSTAKFPTEFFVSFLDEKYVRYDYQFIFDHEEILEERLDFFPNGNKNNLFVRKTSKETESILHDVVLGKAFEGKRVEKKILPNQLYLSKVGGNMGHPQMTPIYKYLAGIVVWNALDKLDVLVSAISKEMEKEVNTKMLDNLSNLIRVADTQIDNVKIKTVSESEFNFPRHLAETDKKRVIEDFRHRPVAVHKVFSKNEKTDTIEFSMDEESEGTKRLYGVGGLILDVLKKGKTIFLDELDNSLHPRLCLFLIRLFQNPKTNKKHAQLIFATHEVSLLDKAVFRKDQIWFTEKNYKGESVIFSAKEFEDVRDDSPFDKWYTAGKFGAYPKIKELEFINSYE